MRGSATGRLAFMEKPVFGRLTVCFKSTLCESIGGVTTMLAAGNAATAAPGHARGPSSFRTPRPKIGQSAGPNRRKQNRLGRRQTCTRSAKMLNSAMDVKVKPYRVLVCDDQADVLE